MSDPQPEQSTAVSPAGRAGRARRAAVSPAGPAADPAAGPPADRRRRPGRAALVSAVVVAVTCAGCASSAPRRAHPARLTNPYGLPQTTVTVAEDGCGQGWSHPRAGAQVLQLRNTGSVVTDAYLVNARTEAVYQEAEGIGVGASQPMRVTLGGGSYAVECLPEDLDVVKGPTVRVPGGAVKGSTPAIAPANVHQLIPPTLAYQKWVQGRLDQLVVKTDALRAAIDRGDLDAARAAWLPAHTGYEELSGAKLTFGDADAAINGTTAGLPGGVHDPHFTGFHRIEYGLWHGGSASSLRPSADRLAAELSTLRKTWPQAEMDPLYLSQRGHEIMENALQFELTGRTDYGSGTNLATVQANLAGTREMLDCMRPLLNSRVPGLMTKIDTWMRRTERDVDSFAHDGHWTPVNRLGRTQRETLDADMSALTEQLAPIAAILDVRRTR